MVHFMRIVSDTHLMLAEYFVYFYWNGNEFFFLGNQYSLQSLIKGLPLFYICVNFNIFNQKRNGTSHIVFWF